MQNLSNLSGQKLGQFELRSLIGVGGMGAVYRGYQPSLDRDVAIKVLSPELTHESQYIERFNREALVVARLEHPNIVPIYDYGTVDECSYVVMRLLTGGSLQDRLKYLQKDEIALPSVDEVISVLRQLASALDYAHQRHIIHRDIKPSNVMFDEVGTAYLVDFGIARILEQEVSQLTGTGHTVGTLRYMAPEQFREEEPTPAVDQYALGVMTFLLLSGKAPYEATNIAAYTLKLIQDPVPKVSEMRPELGTNVDTVFEKVMAKRSEDRYPSASAFVDVLESALANTGPGIANKTPTGFFLKPIPGQQVAQPTPGSQSSPFKQGGSSAPRTDPTLVDLPSDTGLGRLVPPMRGRRSGMAVIVAVFGLMAILAGVIGFAIAQSQQEPPRGLLVAMGMIPGWTETPTATATVIPATATQTPVPAIADVPTATDAPTATATQTPMATETPPPTGTSTHTATIIPQPSSTPVPSEAYTATMDIMGTVTVEVARLATQLATITPTSTSTLIPTRQPTETATATIPSIMRTATVEVARFATQFAAITPSATSTSTWTPTSTNTPSPILDSVMGRIMATFGTLRSGPGVEYPLVYQFSGGTVLNVVGRTDDAQTSLEWYQIELDTGDLVWIKANLVELSANPLSVPVVTDIGIPDISQLATLTTTPTSIVIMTQSQVTAQGTVSVEQADLRSGPGTQYRILTTLSEGTVLSITGRTGQASTSDIVWLLVGQTSNTGIWTSIDQVDLSVELGSIPIISNPTLPVMLRIIVDTADLRRGPGTNYSRAGSASRGTEFEVLAYYGEWYQIQKRRYVDTWIWSGMVELNGDPRDIELATNIPEPPIIPTTERGQILTITSDIAYYRNGPNSSYDRIGSASQGTEFHILNRDGDWYQIETDSGDAWIWSGIVELIGHRYPGEAITSTNVPVSITPTRTIMPTSFAVVDTEVANLRGGPGTNYSRVGSASRGAEFEVLAYYGDWYQIDIDDGDAWIWSGIVVLDGNPDDIQLATDIPEPPVILNASQSEESSSSVSGSECNPGEWAVGCGANDCEPSESAQCNDQGNGWVCIPNPATCGSGGSGPPPPSGGSDTCLYDYGDYQQLQACFLKDPATNPQCRQWDLNNDGIVDSADYLIMSRNYCDD